VTKCVFGFSLKFMSEMLLRRIERDIVINADWSSCKIPVIPVRY